MKGIMTLNYVHNTVNTIIHVSYTIIRICVHTYVRVCVCAYTCILNTIGIIILFQYSRYTYTNLDKLRLYYLITFFMLKFMSLMIKIDFSVLTKEYKYLLFVIGKKKLNKNTLKLPIIFIVIFFFF